MGKAGCLRVAFPAFRAGKRGIYGNCRFADGFPGISVIAIFQNSVQIMFNCLFLYLAVTPIITITARIPNGHMTGAVVAFVYGYGGMFTNGNILLGNIYPVTASLLRRV